MDLLPTIALTQLPFSQAATAWLETRRHHLSPRTFLDYTNYIKTLAVYFGEMRIPEIDGDMMRSYQRARRLKAGPGNINKELGIVRQIRERIGSPILDYQPLQMPKDYESPGRKLTDSEEAVFERVCKAAADHKTWDVAALCSLLSMKTGMGPGEILSLKIKDVVFGDPPYIVVQRRGAKRVRRERTVVLGETASWAADRLVRRAKQKCDCTIDDHFLVPFMNRDHSYDPTKPAVSYREGMSHLLAIAETQFRPYDLRHHAVSRALGNPKVSLTAASLHFGHISGKMKARYYHGDLETLKIVAAAIDKKPVQSVEIFKPLKTGRR